MTVLSRRERVERGIYRNPKTGRYEFTFTDSDGGQRWVTVDGNLKAARAARAEVVAKLAKGVRVAPSKRTLEAVGAECMAAQRHLRPRTRQVYETSLKTHVYPTLGKRKVAKITVDDVAKLIGKLEAKGLAPWTIRGVLSALGRVFGYAQRHGMIETNPIRLLEPGERPKVERHEMRFLDMGEIERLLAEVVAGYKAAITTAIFTGLRQGELLGLQWRDVHFGAEPSGSTGS